MCIENERVEIFCENVGKFHCHRQRDPLEYVFISDGIMFEDFFNGGWPCRYRVENLSVKKMFKIFS